MESGWTGTRGEATGTRTARTRDEACMVFNTRQPGTVSLNILRAEGRAEGHCIEVLQIIHPYQTLPEREESVSKAHCESCVVLEARRVKRLRDPSGE